jgi:hypothetical protein
MMSAFSQYSPQGLLPQFPGMQAEFGQAGSGQPFPFAGQGNSFLQNPFSGGQFGPSPFAANPYLQSQWLQSPVGHNPLQNSFAGQAGTNIATQQIVQALGQLAQQIAVQNAVAQQIGFAVHQLAHQLATQGLQGYPGSGLGAGQPFAGAGQAFIGGTPQPFGQGGYGGLSPQSQGWGANRQQTIQ